MPVKIVICRSEKCKKEIVYLTNAETGHAIPVNYDSLTMDEIKGFAQGVNVLYNKQHHKSHFLTCAEPNRFSRKKLGSRGRKL